MWSRYRRKQSLSSLDEAQMPIKAYGNYLMNYHNAKLVVGFNFMELWPRRQAQWFNIWVGTGAGYMMAKGNEYGIYFNTTITENGTSKPATGDINIDNNSSVSIQGNVRTTNDHSSFNRLYIPASLHVEFDVSRQVTIGLKGEMDFVMNRKDIAPKNLAFGLVTLRYNFVPGKAKKMKKHYDSRLASMDANVADALRRADAEKARADQAEAERQLAQLIGKTRLYQFLPPNERKLLPAMEFTDSHINAIARVYYADKNFGRENSATDIDLWRVYNLFTGANKSSSSTHFSTAR